MRDDEVLDPEAVGLVLVKRTWAGTGALPAEPLLVKEEHIALFVDIGVERGKRSVGRLFAGVGEHAFGFSLLHQSLLETFRIFVLGSTVHLRALVFQNLVGATQLRVFAGELAHLRCHAVHHEVRGDAPLQRKPCDGRLRGVLGPPCL